MSNDLSFRSCWSFEQKSNRTKEHIQSWRTNESHPLVPTEQFFNAYLWRLQMNSFRLKVRRSTKNSVAAAPAAASMAPAPASSGEPALRVPAGAPEEEDAGMAFESIDESLVPIYSPKVTTTAGGAAAGVMLHWCYAKTTLYRPKACCLTACTVTQPASSHNFTMEGSQVVASLGRCL